MPPDEFLPEKNPKPDIADGFRKALGGRPAIIVAFFLVGGVVFGALGCGVATFLFLHVRLGPETEKPAPAAIQSQNGSNPSNPQPAQPSQAQQPNQPVIAAAPPKPSATVGEVDKRLTFLESDCPSADVSNMTPYPSTGDITCNFAAHNGQIDESFSIRQYQDFNLGDLQTAWSSAQDYFQKQINAYQGKPNGRLSTVKTDATDNLFLVFYDGDIPAGQKTAPLCAFGGGNQILDKYFLVGFNFQSCTLTSSDDYLSAFDTLVGSARQALTQAEGRAKP